MIENNKIKIKTEIEIVKIEEYSEFSQEFLKEIEKITKFKNWLLERIYENIENNSMYSAIKYQIKIDNLHYTFQFSKYFSDREYCEKIYLNYCLDVSIWHYSLGQSVFITKYDNLTLNQLTEVLEYLKLQNDFIL